MSRHVCLVSDQAVPNITPVLDPDTRPAAVTLVVAPEMERQARWLKKVLREACGVPVERWPVADAWDAEHLLGRFMELLEAHDDLILNATCGTRPMSIAAFEAFRAYERPVFYVHPFTDELFWLHPHDRPRHQLADRIKLRHFLLACGAEIKASADIRIPPAYRELTAYLVLRVEDFAGALRVLNWYAASARETLESEPIRSEYLHRPEFLELLNRFQAVDALRIRHGRLVFPDENARFFVNGGWLEEHVFSQVQQLRRRLPLIQDLARNLLIARDTGHGEVENELDVVFLANNHLYLIECKTRHFHPEEADENGPGAEAIYKLDTLKEVLGGLHGRGILVSYLPLAEPDRRRAADLGIRVCEGRQIQDLPHIFREWII
ncbi:hypothetical protein MIT9_P1020 [Methylomarinovum caldicuralii]|uniref:DUF1887 domain-containing protein n=1 Tax=Methylomarinovum caldicuralii TaxID=438856 RepID=A0AAU9CU55_9GAMM|nr:DUF1887 family CARF protein [Methylomarinovum caldicuralii]BCX81442.1 hypothetical protein MIT9_P1020 [Methylomarinovum caldicuralii]